MLKKAQSLLMLAALVLLAAFLLSFGNNLLQAASCIVGHTGKVARNGSLPRLAESIAPSLPDSTARQTDNGTPPVTSGGAVEASFTVVSRPGSGQAEGRTPSTANEESGFGSSPAATSAQDENGVAGDRQLRNDHSGTGAGVGPKSGGLTLGWVLLMGALVVAIGTVDVVLICRSRAGKRSPRLKDSGDSCRQPPVRELGDQAT
jgi:hypothetical protein